MEQSEINSKKMWFRKKNPKQTKTFYATLVKELSEQFLFLFSNKKVHIRTLQSVLKLSVARINLLSLQFEF